jgi:hypothetical protein
MSARFRAVRNTKTRLYMSSRHTQDGKVSGKNKSPSQHGLVILMAR